MRLAVPVIVFSKSEDFAKSFIDTLKPDYDVIHVIQSTKIAQDELPALLSGQAQKPHSNLGSNMHNASIAHSGKHPTPKAVIIAGKHSGADLEKIESLVGKKSVPLLTDTQCADTQPEDAAARARHILQENGLDPATEGIVGKGAVWGF